MSSWFNGREDWEGANCKGVVMEDNDNADVEVGESTPTLRGAFREGNSDDDVDGDK